MKSILSFKSKSSLKEIYDYIALDSKVSANKQMQKIYNTIELIKSNPHMGVVGRVENTREFFIPNTNYFIVYKVIDNVLNIINIIHTSRNYELFKSHYKEKN